MNDALTATDPFAILRKLRKVSVTAVTSVTDLNYNDNPVGSSVTPSVTSVTDCPNLPDCVTAVTASVTADDGKSLMNTTCDGCDGCDGTFSPTLEWLDNASERAAVLIVDAGVPDCYASDLAVLFSAPCPGGLSTERWHRAHDALGRLIDDCSGLAWVVKQSRIGDMK